MDSRKLISKRVNFPSTHEMAERYSYGFAAKFGFDEENRIFIKTALAQIFSSLLSDLQSALITGSEKGINEALALIEDPEYYETVKKRSRKQRDKHREFRREETERRAERERRRTNPTIEEKKADVQRALSEMIRLQDEYLKARNKITKFAEQHGETLISEVIVEKFPLPDLWLETHDINKFVRRLTYSEVSDFKQADQKNPEDNVINFFDWK